ncbi:hypothetical protein [Paenibacillus sanguinis]|uniref:hypothetical protein n=1 Tax=Paenibacillus sanguinis TaxID=225906 RepID=UPI0003634BE3|nr:hypothetical protein [Paenibacillus sanguinis]
MEIIQECEFDINDDYVEFYSCFLGDEEQALCLIKRCYKITEVDVRPRRIVNNIARLITLADDQMKIRGGRYGIQIFFWMVCVEAIYNISKPLNPKKDKITTIRKFFNESILREDQLFILDHITRSIVDYRWNYTKHLHMNIIANIFYFVRNDFVHEGSYSNFHFKSEDSSTTIMNSIVLKEFKDDVFEERIYDVNVTYSQMRDIIIRGCINFLNKHLESFE